MLVASEAFQDLLEVEEGNEQRQCDDDAMCYSGR